MKKYSLTNEAYNNWTAKEISEDFENSDYVEITILDDDEINMVGLTTKQWLDDNVAHGQEDVFYFNQVGKYKSMSELESDIIIAGAVQF